MSQFFIQRKSIAVQRHNASCVMGTFNHPKTDSQEERHYSLNVLLQVIPTTLEFGIAYVDEMQPINFSVQSEMSSLIKPTDDDYSKVLSNQLLITYTKHFSKHFYINVAINSAIKTLIPATRTTCKLNRKFKKTKKENQNSESP